ncbi:MAG: Uma2 family endonuclease [Leptolyngbyaceae cyanobacterium MO_188.B28]|nr:Uma2 family endonuclease [Leptolyngbyaceae cyanobacterium MO_188.B28]
MLQTPIAADVLYPDSDGEAMADNTIQYRWIVRLVTNLKRLLTDQTAFVAGDLLWYPIQVKVPPVPVQAPDVMVVLGRPDGDLPIATLRERGSYKQWEEDKIAPQVVFEILSPSNSAREMLAKQAFYREHGVLEMFFYDPDSYDFWGLVRKNLDEDFSPLTPINFPWVSPTLKIRFELFDDGLVIFHPDGELFKDPGEFIKERDRAFAKLRELGIDPEQL